MISLDILLILTFTTKLFVLFNNVDVDSMIFFYYIFKEALSNIFLLYKGSGLDAASCALLNLYIILYVFVHSPVSCLRMRAHARARLGRREDNNSQDGVLGSLYDARVQTEVIRLSSKCLRSLSHLISPGLSFLKKAKLPVEQLPNP